MTEITPSGDAPVVSKIDAIVDAATIKEEPKKPEAELERPAEELKEPEGERKREEPRDDAATRERKADNYISKLNRNIGRQAATIEHLEKELAALRNQQMPPPPKEEDFEGKTIAEFATAQAKHAAKEEFQGMQTEAAEKKLSEAKKEIQDDRKAAVDESAVQARKVFPDFDKLIDQHCTMLRPDGSKYMHLSDYARDALHEADTGNAIYSILREGALDELNAQPSLAKAAMFVRDHEIKAQQLSKVKKISSAPEPISSPKGTASGGKTLESMSGKEIREWMKA